MADTPTIARVRLRDAVAKVPAKKAPKAVTKPHKGASDAERVRKLRAVRADLLAALKALLGVSVESVGMSYGERVDLAKAAISKAERGK